MDRQDLDHLIGESLALEAEDAKKSGAIGYMARMLVEVAQFVRTVFSIFKVEALPDVRLPVQPSAASRKMPRLVFFSLIVNGDGICCTSPDIA